MVEAIPFAIAADLLKKLGSATFQELGLIYGVNKEFKKLENTLSTIKAVLLDAEEKQQKSHLVQDWVRKLKDVVYDADDVFDEMTSRTLRRRMSNQVCEFLSSMNQVVFRVSIGSKIIEIRERVDEIADNMTKFGFRVDVNLADRKREESVQHTHSFVLTSEIVGRENNREEIVGLMLCLRNHENVSVFPIVGIGGLGKTTLAQLVYNDEKVVNFFEHRIWVHVSESFNIKVILGKILKSLRNSELESLEMDQLQIQIRECLDGKRYLLVLDDVWNDNRERWVQLKNLLMGGAQGSKIIVTTRSRKVASVMGIDSPYVLDGLTEDESWTLFEKLAFRGGEHRSVHPNLVKIGKKIVKSCKGVPLAIRTLGSAMQSKTEESEWLSIQNSEIWRLSQDDNDILPVLKLSYDHLSIHLRQCFAYCSVFPKDYEIAKELLVQLWMAQGYLQSNLEDVGDQYFKELLSRSFFQEVEKDGYNNIKSCKMHDLIHDLAQSIAGTDCSNTKGDAQNISSRVHHVSLDYYLPPHWEIPRQLLKAKGVRTFFLPIHDGLRNESAREALISNLRGLRVLDLHSSRIKRLSDSIGVLIHLRYLDLSRNYEMERLPYSITKLCNLQTLKLSHCEQLKELPRDIRKLISLRCLMIDGCASLTHMPSGLGKLTTLQTLPRFVVVKDQGAFPGSGELAELKGLNHLRGELCLENLENVKDVALKSKDAKIKAKQYLQSLILKWGLEATNYEDAETLLTNLRPHRNLKELFVRGYGGLRFPTWLSSLSNLVKITLGNCRSCQHLPPLDQLPSLKFLKLEKLASLEYVDNGHDKPSPFSGDNLEEGEGSASTLAFFPSLKELTLFDLPNLKGWYQHQQLLLPSFSCLSILYIYNCPELTSMPHHPFLEELELYKVSEKLIQHQSKMMANTSPLSTLKSLEISGAEDLQSFPEEWLQTLTSLESLKISWCPKLQTLAKEGFKGLTSLKSLWIYGCETLASLSGGIQLLTALEKLNIGKCKELDLSSHADDEMQSSQSLTKLRTLFIDDMPKLLSLPTWLQHVNALQFLQIRDCPELMNLSEWIGNLTSLQQLQILKCPKLSSLPETMSSLSSLQKLTIFSCPNLSERCQKETGHDWHKISHIPEIDVDYSTIQQRS